MKASISGIIGLGASRLLELLSKKAAKLSEWQKEYGSLLLISTAFEFHRRPYAEVLS